MHLSALKIIGDVIWTEGIKKVSFYLEQVAPVNKLYAFFVLPVLWKSRGSWDTRLLPGSWCTLEPIPMLRFMYETSEASPSYLSWHPLPPWVEMIPPHTHTQSPPTIGKHSLISSSNFLGISSVKQISFFITWNLTIWPGPSGSPPPSQGYPKSSRFGWFINLGGGSSVPSSSSWFHIPRETGNSPPGQWTIKS